MVQQHGLSSCTRDLATRQASNNYCLAVSHTKHILDPSPRPPHFFHCLGDVERILPFLLLLWGFPGSSVGKESTCNADPGSIAGSGRFPWRRDRLPTPVFLGFPYGSAGKEPTCNVEDLGSIPGLGRFPWRRERLPTAVFWPGEFHAVYFSGVWKSCL